MRRLVFGSAALALSWAAFAEIAVTTDCPDGLRRCGERTVFTVCVTDGTGGVLPTGRVSVVVDNFGSRVQLKRTFDLSAGNPLTVAGSLAEPGFLRATVTCGKDRVLRSVGYDVAAIRQDEPCPDDFDAYWSAEKARLAATVPLDPKCALDERLSKGRPWETYRISFATFGGKRVYGFMTVPRDRRQAPFRARIRICDAGGGATAPWEANDGEVTATLNVYDFEPADNGPEQKRRVAKMDEALRKKYGLGESATYRTAGISVSREDYFFHDTLLGLDRAIDWIAARPEVDPSRIVYFGSSQGGGFGLFVNCLNTHFSRACFAVPALTGHYGYRQGRLDGWPTLVRSQPAKGCATAEKFAAYFDGVNFAARIRHPVRFIVGFSDACCPPPCVYAAYNVCPSSDKAIVNCLDAGHDGFDRWIKENPDGPTRLDYNAWLRAK